jgi:cell wall-associated NlpC family hydrolase
MSEDFGTTLDQIDALNAVNARPAPQADDLGVMDPVAEAEQRIGLRRAEELQERSIEAMQEELEQTQRFIESGRVEYPDEPKGKKRRGGNDEVNMDNTDKLGIVDYARQFLGTPYKWGGSSPLGMDCSGFIQTVMKQFGVDLPHSSVAMAQLGRRVSRGEMRVGDLVFSDLSGRNGSGYNGIDHVGMYIGNGKIIESSRVGNGGVQIGTLGSGIWDNYWASRYLGETGGKYGNRMV